MAQRIATSRAGYTLVELTIVAVLGVVIMSATLSFAITSAQSSEANVLREEVFRNARFIGMSLERDLQFTGAGISSDIRLGTLSTFNDTLVVFYVPWEPSEPYPYEIAPPFGTGNPLPPGGTCGTYCIDLNKAPDGTFDLEAGDIARLQINSVRRLILITNVAPSGGKMAVSFAASDTLLHFEAGLSGGVQLDRFSTVVQKVQPIVYFTKGEVLYRSTQLNASGDLIASPMAYGVKAWDAKMVFLDGDEEDEADPYDLDYSNDFDDILGTRISATLGANRAHGSLAGGEVFIRDYLWRSYPRNLAYERNR